MGQLYMDYPWEMDVLDINVEREMRTNNYHSFSLRSLTF